VILQQPPRRLGSVSVIPIVDDSSILVPPSLQPVTIFPSILSARFQAGSVNPVPAGTFIDETHYGDGQEFKGASQSLSQLFVSRLAAGLWEINVTLSAYSTTGIHIQTAWAMLNPGGTFSVTLLPMLTLTNGNENMTRTLVLNLADRGWQPFLQISATGVGEGHGAIGNILLSRLA
jgi:hypothetical protein